VGGPVAPQIRYTPLLLSPDIRPSGMLLFFALMEMHTKGILLTLFESSG
jgi:hypothetical protein